MSWCEQYDRSNDLGTAPALAKLYAWAYQIMMPLPTCQTHPLSVVHEMSSQRYFGAGRCVIVLSGEGHWGLVQNLLGDSVEKVFIIDVWIASVLREVEGRYQSWLL